MKQPYNDEDLFAGALALPAAERSHYLERACAKDAVAFNRLTALVAAFGDAKNFAKEYSVVAQDAADQIGPYRLLRELGEGGCGIAYLAEQTAPIKRHVALKVIKPGMDTKAVIARFEAERQVLALMDHPNVAKVFDAGITPIGRPYFAMELVRGVKITDYCDQCRLGVPERLSLFIQVCQGIQHAHGHGIVHRDIKPSNVLVTQHGGIPLAKVIDFGLAKAIHGRSIEMTLQTALGEFIGTPTYVSPEQTGLGITTIDERSDVYSLGVLLYEMLTGCTPFDTADLLKGGLESMRKRIYEEEPLTPSRRLRALSIEQASHASTSGRADRTALVRVLQRDLDWIVMRCLEKKRERRYQAADELARDLQRYLRHEAVVARPPRISYIVTKLIRRHRSVCIVGSIATTCLFATLALAFLMEERASSERAHAKKESERAEHMSKVVIDVLEVADPYESSGRKVTAEALLDEAGRSIGTELSQQSPKARASLLEAIGRAHRRQGHTVQALNYFQEAVRLRKHMQDHSATAAAISELARTMHGDGDAAKAEQLMAEAIAIARMHGLDRSALYAGLLRRRGWIKLSLGNLPEAKQDLEESLELSRSLFGAQSLVVADVLASLARASQWTDNFPEAERASREALTIYTNMLLPRHPDRLKAQARLAEVLDLQGRFDEALPLLLECLQIQNEVFGGRGVEVADTLDSLAHVKYMQGHLAEAEEFARNALRAGAAGRRAAHPDLANQRTALAIVLIARSKYSEAETELRRALRALTAALPPDHQYIASAEYLLGEVFLATGRLGEAETVLTASMNRWKRAGAPGWRAARSANALGEALHRQGRIEDAEKYLTESFRELSTSPNADLAAKNKARERVARYLKSISARAKDRSADPAGIQTPHMNETADKGYQNELAAFM